MPNTTTVNASISILDTGVTPAVTVAQNAVTDQQSSLQEYDAMAFVLPAGVLWGAPLIIDLAPFKPKSVYVTCTQKMEMKIGLGATDIHKVRSSALYTFSATEPVQLSFATGAGITTDTTVKVILGSAHP